MSFMNNTHMTEKDSLLISGELDAILQERETLFQGTEQMATNDDDDGEGQEMIYEGQEAPQSRHVRGKSFRGSGVLETLLVNEIVSDTQLYQNTVNPFAVPTKADDLCEIIPNEVPKVLAIADDHGHVLNLPPEEEDAATFGTLEEVDLDNLDTSNAPRSVLTAGIESLKYCYSTTLLVFSVVVVMAALFTNQTVATADMNLHPALAFVIFWFLIIWLGIMEGGQGALVGLQPIDAEKYRASHPRTFRNTTLVRVDSLERFILGRQYLVVLVITVINLMGSSVANASVLRLDQWANEVFLASGVAMILVTIMIAQLPAQLIAAHCMIDFINNYAMLVTSYISLGIEFSGLLHCVYLVQMLFGRLAGTSKMTSSQTIWGRAFFWTRVVLSLFILGFCLAVTIIALYQGNTNMWKGVPWYASVIILFLLMALVGMMEGLQVALFAVINLDQKELRKHAAAHRNTQFALKDLQAFLIGRQIFVATCVFVVARIATPVYKADDANIFGVSDGFQAFLNSGLTGALVTTILGSLAWRIVASSFPLEFLSNPVVNILIRICLVLESSGICSGSWILARFMKLGRGFQPDEVYLEGSPRHTSEPVTRRDADIDLLLTVLKLVYSTALLVFCVVLVMAAIFTDQTVATADFGLHSAAAFCIFWFLIIWLAMLEGGQAALVGLQPIDKALYKKSHPRTFMNTQLVHRGDNLVRFIVGRQYLVVLVITVINLMGSSVANVSVLGLPMWVNEVFLATGVSMILVTIMIGQLTAQVNSANCMLDFINNYFMLFTSYVSLGIEFSGLLHSVYLVQLVFAAITGKPIESKEPPRNMLQQIFFWGRMLVSLVVIGFCLAVTLVALFDGKTRMWPGVPPYMSVIVLFILMIVVGILEGLQIALFAMVNIDEEEIRQHSIAYANCKLTFRDQNLQAFLIGRQIFVATCMFVVARIVTPAYNEEDDNIFGVSDGVQTFLNTGLTGAVITTVLGSLSWRIIASSFPLAFLSNPLIYIIVRICMFLENVGICSGVWVLGRVNKLLVTYQPDEVYLKDAERHGRTPITKRDKEIDISVTTVKYLASIALLIFSVTVVMAAIFTRQTTVAQDTYPLVAFFIFWFLIVWLAMMEGGQGCLVGLQPVDKQLYKDTHKVTFKCTTLAHKGDNMRRFIVGRQFLVVLTFFVINMCGAAVAGASVLGLPDWANQAFLQVGLAMILTTIILGQLISQVNAANCMLDFINTRFMVFTTWVSLLIESSGLLHSVYLVQYLLARLTAKSVGSNEPDRSIVQRFFFWGRVLMSLVILGFCFAVTLTALFDGKTTMYGDVPPYVSVILFFLLMIIVGLMEGMQIALFAVINLPKEEIDQHHLARKVCDLCFTGQNLQAFLVGRQIFVATCMFVVARIASPNYDYNANETLWGISNGLQRFFNTGLTGAVITTILGSLAWRIVASSFPVAFLSNPLIYIIIRICFLLEASGICSAVWLLALVHKKLVVLQPDEVYIASAATSTSQEDDEEAAINN